jgi:tetratricopeptide (TPR) repeat protein
MKEKLLQDDFIEAIPQLEMAIALDHANEHVAFSFLGSALARQGKSEEAIDCFRQAVAFQSGYADAHFGLAMSLAARGEYPEAIYHFQRTLALRPSHAQAQRYLELAIQQNKSTAAHQGNGR